MLERPTHLSFRMNKAPSWTRTVEAKTAKTSSLSNLQTRGTHTHTHSQIYIHNTPTHSSKSKNADVLDSCGQFLAALSTYKQYSHCSGFGGRGRSAQHLQGWMLDSDSGSKCFPETRFLFSWASVKNKKVKNGRLRAKKGQLRSKNSQI